MAVRLSIIQATICVHVLAGAVWTLTAFVIAVTGRATRALLIPQMMAALIAVVAGIDLWHALHRGPFGPTEHVLVVGSFLAMIALGLQLGIAVPMLLGAPEPRLTGGGLLLQRASVVVLAGAAIAMVGSWLR